MIDTNGNPTAVILASIGNGTTTGVEINDDLMIFTPWINNLAGRHEPRPASELDAARRRMSPHDQKLMCNVLSGDVSWSATNESLTFTKPGVGCLDFVAALAARD